MSARSASASLRRAAWSAYVALDAPRQWRFPFSSPAAIERAQSTRVRKAVAHAYRHVPYYGETLNRLGASPDDFQTARDLARLPLIERDQLQRDPEYFVSRARPIAHYLNLRTGGSSGEPVTIFNDPSALFQGLSHWERQRPAVMRVTRRRLPIRRVSIEFPLSSERRRRQALGERSFLGRLGAVAPKQLSLLDPPARNIELINELRPGFVSSYGSYIEALFVHLHSTGQSFHRPKLVHYSADGLSEQIRQLITDTYGIPVLSLYGAVEADRIGFECERHSGYHLNLDLYPVRIVDSGGRELTPEESGDVVVSNLVNRGTMLLNYRLGDLASRRPVRCPCGRSLPLLSFVQGRSDDWLESSAGEMLHPQAVHALFKSIDGAWRYQVTQRSASRFEVAVVPAAGSDREELRMQIGRGFVAWIGDRVTVEVSFVDDLPRTKRGKVRPVISLRSRSDSDHR